MTVTPALDLRAPGQLFIGGQWVPSDEGLTTDIECPATGERIGRVADATERDVDRAVQAAHEAFVSRWSKTTADERYELLMALADRVLEHGDRLRMIDTVDSGSTIRVIGEDVEHAANFLRMYAGFARQMRGTSVALNPDRVTYTVREPYGVVVHPIPFNRPLRFAAHALGVTLAGGNTTVLKPSEYTPLATLELAELSRTIFPPGVINVLTGFGPRCGAPMVTHRLVDKVHFRGSAPTGKRVAVQCAERSVPYTLELGGKNPMVVYPDADVAAAARGGVKALNLGIQGQSCSSATRLLVHHDIYDEYRDRLVAEFAAVRPGLPWDRSADMGSIVSRPQYDRVMGFIESGRRSGATLLAGGTQVEDPALANGLYIEPTLFETSDPTIEIATEEIFGPVTCLLRWTDEDEAIRIANSVAYGHCASVWTRDLATAHRVSNRLDVGVVWVNDHSVRPDGMPFGARKASGIGQEHAIEELGYYTQEKSIMINIGSA